MRSYLDAEYCRQVSRQWDFATAALGNWGNEGAVHERSPKALEMQAAVEQTACEFLKQRATCLALFRT